MRANQNGFTLIEFLLVLSILAGASLMLLTITASLEEQRLNLTSTQIMEELREVKQAAITEAVWYQVKFFPANSSYTINREGQRKKEIRLPDGVHFAYTPDNIIFDAKGMPLVGGTILLVSGDQQKKVIIAPVGGRIREE